MWGQGSPRERGGRTKRGECEGGLEGWGFGGAEVFPNYVEVAKGSEE